MKQLIIDTFMFEEKHQMPKKISKDSKVLINGIDIDKWMEDPDIAAQIEDEPQLKYDQKLVAFLDLLGISKEIQDKVGGLESEIISKMSKIKDIVEIEVNAAPMNDQMTMLYISDSFIFVCEQEAFEPFLQVLSNIQMRILVECRTMLRGALEYGEVIVQDYGKQIIGPAYIAAYMKQEKDAIFPRIVVSNSVLEHFASKLTEYSDFVISQDRETSLDYVGVYMVIEGKAKRDIATKLRREGVFDYLSEGYKKSNEENNSSVRSKYAWTINYFKEKGIWSDEKQYHCW